MNEMTNAEEPEFKFNSKVVEKQDNQYGRILYFPVSYQETNEKLRKHSFKPGDRVVVTVRLKNNAEGAEI